MIHYIPIFFVLLHVACCQDMTITTIAGTGTYGFSGNNGQATSAAFKHPFDVALDSSGRVWLIADWIFKISLTYSLCCL